MESTFPCDSLIGYLIEAALLLIDLTQIFFVKNWFWPSKKRSVQFSRYVVLWILTVLRIRDVYPGSLFLSFPDLGSNNGNKRGRANKFSLAYLFLLPQIYQNLVILFFFTRYRKKFEPNLTKNYGTQKIVTKLSKIWFGNPGSGKNPSRIQGSKWHRIPNADPQLWIQKVGSR